MKLIVDNHQIFCSIPALPAETSTEEFSPLSFYIHMFLCSACMLVEV